MSAASEFLRAIRSPLAAALAAAVVAAAAVRCPAAESVVADAAAVDPVVFEAFPFTDERVQALWPEVIQPGLLYQPTAYIASFVDPSDGDFLTVTMVHASEWCARQMCTVKILRGAHEVDGFSGCDDPGGYAMSKAYDAVYACGVEHRIPAPSVFGR